VIGSAGCDEDKTCGGVTAIGAQQNSAVLMTDDHSVWGWRPGFRDPVRAFTAPDDVTGFVNAQLCLRYASGAALCDPSLTSSRLTSLSGAKQFSSWVDTLLDGPGSDCAVMQDDSLSCWLPGQTAFTTVWQGIRNVAAGQWHTCAIALDGSLACHASIGGIADWDTARPDLTDVAEVVSLVVPAASELRTTTGEVWSLYQAQIPSEPADSILQAPITGIDGSIAQLIAGYEYSCALRTDGAVFCWAEGSRQNAEVLLQVSDPERRVPYRITTLPRPATALAGGDFFVCALLEDTTVWCWGLVGGDHRSGSPRGGFVESCR
jgi:alpha-tubulin suppressor-like RCC1 family protein